MKIKAINYDLQNGDMDDYQDLFKAIKTIGQARHAQGSFWLVKTDKTSAAIRDLLKIHLKPGDKLMISTFSEWASYQMNTTAEWLNE